MKSSACQSTYWLHGVDQCRFAGCVEQADTLSTDDQLLSVKALLSTTVTLFQNLEEQIPLNRQQIYSTLLPQVIADLEVRIQHRTSNQSRRHAVLISFPTSVYISRRMNSAGYVSTTSFTAAPLLIRTRLWA